MCVDNREGLDSHRSGVMAADRLFGGSSFGEGYDDVTEGYGLAGAGC